MTTHNLFILASGNTTRNENVPDECGKIKVILKNYKSNLQNIHVSLGIAHSRSPPFLLKNVAGNDVFSYFYVVTYYNRSLYSIDL